MKTYDLVPVIRIYDPACAVHDKEVNEAWTRYGLTRDPDLIPQITVPGERPTTFYVRRATRAGIRHIRGGVTQEDRHERAFAVCVARVTDKRRKDGRRVDVDLPDGGGATPMSDTLLEQFAEVDVQEIGSVAMGLSFLAHDLPAYFPPPATSWGALRALMSHPAAPTNDASTSSSPPNSE